MKLYVQQHIPSEDQYLLEKIKKVVQMLPDMDLGKDESGKPIELSCHMLARALARRFNVNWRDGLFADKYNHSWLVTENGHIIDPYPVATLGGPVLIDGGVGSPSRKLYKSSRGQYKGQFSKLSFVKSIHKITKELDRTMTRLGIEYK